MNRLKKPLATTRIFRLRIDLDPSPVDVDIRVDQTMRTPGDKLYYVYDYGDSWELTIKLEKVLDAADDSPVARCVGGRRWAPPEHCGSRRTAEDLKELLVDPEYRDWLPVDPDAVDLAEFDLPEVNETLDALVNNPLVERAVAGEGPREGPGADLG